MKKLSVFILLIFISVFMSGCIFGGGQYRGALSGVEIQRSQDGTSKINVSGDATVTIDENGKITAQSASNSKFIMDLITSGVSVVK